MCKICQQICMDIEQIFGHRVDPAKLSKLIESSPLPKEDTRPGHKYKFKGVKVRHI